MNDAARELQDLYRELILEHSRNPRNFGRLERATHTAHGINPLCGDKLRLYLQVDEDGRIAATSFEGSGCAISVASASLLTEDVAGMPITDADTRSAAIIERLQGHGSRTVAIDSMEGLEVLDGVRAYPSRVKCATLAWQALRSALNNSTTAATTE